MTLLWHCDGCSETITASLAGGQPPYPWQGTSLGDFCSFECRDEVTRDYEVNRAREARDDARAEREAMR